MNPYAITQLSLGHIRTDGGTQPRVQLNESVVADYADALTEGAKLPPVTVFFDGSEYWLADGFHRFHAHRKIDAIFIDAEVRDGTRRDAVLYSVGANDTHGLRRTNEDKRRAVETLLKDEEWGQQPDQWIAEKCGVGRAFVAKVRKEIILSSDDKIPAEPVKRLVMRNGKTYEMNVAGIGKSIGKSRPLTEVEEQLVAKVTGECVYLLAAAGRVKIGWTRHGARSRVEQILTSTPLATVIAVAAGTRDHEQRTHKSLECERDAGEWFVCSPDAALEAMREVGLQPIMSGPNPATPEPAKPDVPASEVDALRAELAELKSQYDELLSQHEEVVADNASMAAVFEADDKVSAALAEAKKHRELYRIEKERNTGLMNENAQLKRLVMSWKKKAEKAAA